MRIKLECENAKYDERMRILCKRSNMLCAHQRFKPCKGWCVLTEWKSCTGRNHGKTEKTAAGSSN